MSPILQIKLLGDFFLTYGDSPVTGISGRSQALLAYVILNRYAPQPRHRLAFYLWTESTDAQARTNLRKDLSYLRRALPNADQLLLVDAKTLQWQSAESVHVDVVQFEAAIKTAQTSNVDIARSALVQALELYQGDLLPTCDNEWILPERERFQQMQVRALDQLIELLEQQREYRTALSYAQQRLRLDSLNEATYCCLMRLHMQAGDRATALQVYHRCLTLLREELGVDPSSATRKLYEQLLIEDEEPSSQPPLQTRPPNVSALPVPSRSHPPLPPLIGRDQEWASMQQWVSSIAADTASNVLLLVGEPGIGKTRLLEELRATIWANNGQVLWGRGFAAEMVRPYGAWIDALRSIALTVNLPVELGVLLPEVGQPSKALPDRSHLFDAVVQLLSQWASQAPLIVMLDDVQWIDEASSALLHYAIRLLSNSPLLFACTARSGELENNTAILRVVQTLRREQRLQTLELQALDRHQIADLIRFVNANQPSKPSELSADVVERVFVDSGGNPLFAIEVARALLHNHSTSADNLEALICDRLQQLDSPAREFLRWAAALGRSFKPTTVAHVADYPLTTLLMAIEQLEQQMIIRPSAQGNGETSYDFAHDIVRQVVYRQLSKPRCHLLHLQIAHKLNQLDTPDHALAGDIARHASLGGDRPLAATASLLAAERCLKLFAYAEAMELAQSGIQHCQFLDDRARIRLHLGLLRVTALAGVTGDRIAQLDQDIHKLVNEAAALRLIDEEAIGLEALGILQFNQNNFINLHHCSLRVAEASRLASPATAARLLAYGGSCLAEIGRDMVRAEALLQEAQSFAARVGLENCDIFSGLGCVHQHYGRYAEARSLMQQAWRLTQAEQDHWRECTYLSYLAMIELEAGYPTAALPYCQEMAIVAAKIKDQGSEGAFAAALKALADYKLRQPEANVLLEQAIVLLRHVDAKRMLSYVLIGAAEVDLECGWVDLAIDRAKAALHAAQLINHPSEIALAWALLIQGLLASGQQEQATTELKTLHDTIDRHALNIRAQAAVSKVMQYMQEPVATSSHKASKTLKSH